MTGLSSIRTLDMNLPELSLYWYGIEGKNLTGRKENVNFYCHVKQFKVRLITRAWVAGLLLLCNWAFRCLVQTPLHLALQQLPVSQKPSSPRALSTHAFSFNILLWNKKEGKPRHLLSMWGLNTSPRQKQQPTAIKIDS